MLVDADPAAARTRPPSRRSRRRGGRARRAARRGDPAAQGAAGPAHPRCGRAAHRRAGQGADRRRRRAARSIADAGRRPISPRRLEHLDAAAAQPGSRTIATDVDGRPAPARPRRRRRRPGARRLDRPRPRRRARRPGDRAVGAARRARRAAHRAAGGGPADQLPPRRAPAARRPAPRRATICRRCGRCATTSPRATGSSAACCSPPCSGRPSRTWQQVSVDGIVPDNAELLSIRSSPTWRRGRSSSSSCRGWRTVGVEFAADLSLDEIASSIADASTGSTMVRQHPRGRGDHRRRLAKLGVHVPMRTLPEWTAYATALRACGCGSRPSRPRRH